MEQTGSTPTQVLRRQMPAIRARLDDLSAQGLADRITSLGGKLDRAAISKIENGVRNVTLDEALMIAVALDVAPIHLFIPRDDGALVAVAPNLQPVAAATAREWLRGRQQLSGLNKKTYETEVPDSEWGAARELTHREEKARDAAETARRRLRVAKKVVDLIKEELDRDTDRVLAGHQPWEDRLHRELRNARAEAAAAAVDLEEALPDVEPLLVEEVDRGEH
jgi:transcriptional regulator with XRE-family HTH domain